MRLAQVRLLMTSTTLRKLEEEEHFIKFKLHKIVPNIHIYFLLSVIQGRYLTCFKTHQKP